MECCNSFFVMMLLKTAKVHGYCGTLFSIAVKYVCPDKVLKVSVWLSFNSVRWANDSALTNTIMNSNLMTLTYCCALNQCFRGRVWFEKWRRPATHPTVFYCGLVFIVVVIVYARFPSEKAIKCSPESYGGLSSIS